MEIKKVDPAFRILSALAIIFVVAGHADFGVFDVAGMFPYYSFHVGVFVFISGYFYKEEAEKDWLGYIKKKAVHLLLPYYGWNLFYGLLATWLRAGGFAIGSPMSFWNFFLEPFLGGHQYGLNFSAWFVPALFLIEMANLLGRKILGMMKLNRDWLIFLLALTAGAATVIFAQRGSVWGYYKNIGCILFLFPVYQGGHLYAKVLEEKTEKLPTGLYFVIVCAIQYLVLWYSQGRVAYSAVWCSGFLHGPAVPYLTTFLGIAFWLKISRLLSAGWKENCLLDRIGKNTFSIMMHHVTAFFILNTVFSGLAEIGLLTGFDNQKFHIGYEYRYLIMGMENGKWLYLLAGIVLPMIVKDVTNRINIRWVKTRRMPK